MVQMPNAVALAIPFWKRFMPAVV